MRTVTPEVLSRQVRRFADGLPVTAKRATEQSARQVADAVNAGYRRALGPEQRLSGTARGSGQGSRVRARWDVVGQRNPVGRVQALGPAQLIEFPTSPHPIGASALGSRAAIRRRVNAGSGRGAFRQVYRAQVGRGARARQAKRALTIGNNLRAYANHPGTKGSRVFWPAVEREQPKVAGTFGRWLSDDMRKEFT